MSGYPYPGPRAPENNPTPVPQYFTPSTYYIDAITLGKSTTVTTATTHNYVIGQLIRLHIPQAYGTRQLNEREGFVVIIPNPTQVVVDIDSSKYDTFIPSPTYGPTKPQICAVGDINNGAINQNGRVENITYIPGSFRNTSPIEGTWLN